MKLSIALTPAQTKFAPLLFAGNLMHGIQRASALGYDGVEINLRDPARVDLDEIISATRKYGVEIISIGTGQAYLEDGISVAAVDPEVRKRCVQRLYSQVNFASKVNGQVVIGGIRGRFDSDPDIRKYQYTEAIQVVRLVADYALGMGVTITLEPINRYETNFLNNVAETLDFISDVGCKNVKVLIDTFHMNIEEASIEKAIVKVGNLLGHVHLVDSNRCAPGMGHLQFETILEVIRGIGYTGYLSGEFLPIPDDETAACSFLNHIRPLLNK